MMNNVISVVALGSLLIMLYGVLQLITWPEPQECHMTYMFQYPQYTRIPVSVDAEFAPYKLFAYSEGGSSASHPLPPLTGVPVLFVHGHAGSYKQMRSLASVALQKSRTQQRGEPVLNYFAVDFDEALNGVFGAHLQRQTDYLMHAVHAIRALYKAGGAPLMIVGHSMGAKIAQAAVEYRNVSRAVSTLVAISAPVDRPVIDVDFHMDAFYKRIDAFWSSQRSVKRIATNRTALCCQYGDEGDSAERQLAEDNERLVNELADSLDRRSLDRLLLVTIGGGVRDSIVHPGLTGSSFSDLHVMSGNVPGVWRSTDHLCSVWCLEQVLVVNRFLYELGSTSPVRQTKSSRLDVARRHFAPHRLPARNPERRLVSDAQLASDADLDWVQSSQRHYVRRFDALPAERVEMFALRTDVADERQLDVLLVHDEPNFERGVLFGCAALEVHRNGRYCGQATRLDGYARELPVKAASDDRRWAIHVDLHALKRTQPTWTHLLLRLEPSRHRVTAYVDVHGERSADVAHVTMPKWYSFMWSEPMFAHELNGGHFVPVHIGSMYESYKSMEIELLVGSGCRNYRVTAQMCVPWTNGFEQYHLFGSNRSQSMFVGVPVDRPANYNTSRYPVVLNFYNELNIDGRQPSECTVQLRVRNSFARTAANVVQQYAHWLPAHLVTVLLLTIKQQITVTPGQMPFKCDSPLRSLFRSSSFFIITASRLFVKVIEWSQMMPPVDQYEHSMVVSVLVHGSALALISLAMSTLKGTVHVAGSLWQRGALKCGTLFGASCGQSNRFVKETLTLAGVGVIAAAMAGCGENGLLVALVLFLVQIFHKRRVYVNLIAEEAEQNAAKQKKPEKSTDDDESNTDESDDDKNDETEPKVEPASDAIAALSAGRTTDETPLPPIDINDIDRLDELSNEDLNRLIRQTMEENRTKSAQTTGVTDEAKRRAEYDEMDVRKNSEHFHVTLLLLAVVQTGLNAPSLLAWVQNLPYSFSLTIDPSFIPASVTITSLLILWQFGAPQQIKGYTSIGTFLYLMSALSVLYAQDSVYRLNAFISATFVCLAAQQWLCPALPLDAEEDASTTGGPKHKKMFSPAELDAMLDKIMEAERRELEEQRAAELAATEADNLSAHANGIDDAAVTDTDTADDDNDDDDATPTDVEKLIKAQQNGN